MGIAILMVVVLSVLAEVVSPKFAGILSGYPLGSAISLFFMGYEISPQFAAESSLYSMIGLTATMVFSYTYYRASLSARDFGPTLNILISSVLGVAAYFAAAGLLRFAPVTLAAAVPATILSIILFDRLFRNVEDVKIEKRVGGGFGALLFRSLFAAAIIVLITSTAKVVGPRWAGLFSVFPMTMLPLVAIIHFAYDPAHVYAMVKHVPRGLGSIIVYSLAVYYSYPVYGIYAGTAIAYGFATVYLALIQLRPSALFGR